MRSRPLFALFVLLLAGCKDPYTPGLGEIMTQTQIRHAKLWFAGQAGNWPLVEYELHELEESFENAAQFHPTHRNTTAPIKDLIRTMMGGAMGAVKAAAGKKDVAAFTQAHDALTASCNICHQATNFGFNVVVRPGSNSFTNQDFTAPPAAASAPAADTQ